MDADTFVKERFHGGKVGFIGGGNMAKAIGGGMIKKGLAEPQDIYVSAPSDSNLKWWKEQHANTTHSNAEVVKKCSTVILAMKPQYLDAALQSLKGGKDEPMKIADEKLFISVLAGVTTVTLQKKLDAAIKLVKKPSDELSVDTVRVMRVMPNTPTLVGAGCSAYCVGDSSLPSDRMIVMICFSVLGMCVNVNEENMDAVSSISGCGPAFMYLLIEALADGGVRMGLPRLMAQRLAAQTMLGAAEMVLQTNRHPGELKDEVCSPGGSTIAGVYELEKNSVRAAMMAAVEASTKRCEELGKK